MKNMVIMAVATVILSAVALGVALLVAPSAGLWLAGSVAVAGAVALVAGALQELGRHGSAQKALGGFMVAAVLRALVVLGIMIVTLQFNREATIAATLAALFIGVGAAVLEAALAIRQLSSGSDGVSKDAHGSVEGEAAGG